MDGHGADAPHVHPEQSSSNLLFHFIEMSCVDNELSKELVLDPTMSQRS